MFPKRPRAVYTEFRFQFFVPFKDSIVSFDLAHLVCKHMAEVRVGGCYNNNILIADLGTIYNLKS